MPTKQELLDKGLKLIPVENIKIENDPEKTVGYDFTVDNNYTFCTHDGVYVQDSMAAYIPINDKTKNEIKEKLLMSNNLISPANDKLITLPNQDVIFGIYVLTNNLITSLNNKVKYKETKMTEGRKTFNQCLPDDFRPINDNVDKKKLNVILDEVKENYPPEIIKNCLDNIKREGFKYSTLYGSTMSLDKFELENKSNLLEDIYGKETIQEQLREVQSDEIEEDLSKQFYYSPIIKSGARGDWQQVKQVVLTRGFISNFKGKIMEEPIKGCLVDGLNEQEFFNSTYGCRKGLLDVALNTGNSGYLSRKLIMAMANLQLDYDNEDCGTNDYLDIYVEDEYKAKMLIKKYYLDENSNLSLITKDNYKNIVGKKIKIRSPIYCKTYNVCRKCYGELEPNTRYIGIIAAQSLGERATQLVLRTFHTSLRKYAEILDINMNSYPVSEVYDLVKSGKDFYTFSCSEEGKIEVSKVTDAHKDRFEKKIVRVTLDNGKTVDCTLDHEWIMRDGSSKEAKDLKINDSLMPIDDNHKVKNVEIIELDEYEEFYDLTVDSEYHNFALGSGVFIHNSGVASTSSESESMEQEDIVSGLSRVTKLLHREVKEYNHQDLLKNLFDVYRSAGGELLHVHFECLVAQLMWKGDDKWRVLENREHINVEHHSIQSIPEKESWLLALAFSNPRKSILKGILNSGHYKGIFDKILSGEKLN